MVRFKSVSDLQTLSVRPFILMTTAPPTPDFHHTLADDALDALCAAFAALSLSDDSAMMNCTENDSESHHVASVVREAAPPGGPPIFSWKA